MLIRVLAGAAAWIAFLVSSGVSWWSAPESILLLGLLVVAPLGLSLAYMGMPQSYMFRTAQYLQPFATLIAGAAYLIPPGVLAGTLAIAWLPAAALPAVDALHNLRRPAAKGHAEDRIVAASMLFLPASALLLWMDRLGVRPETPLLEAAVQFLFAGFGSLLVAGLTGRALRRQGFAGTLLFLKILTLPLTAAPFVVLLPDSLPTWAHYAGAGIRTASHLGLSLGLLSAGLKLKISPAGRRLLLTAAIAGLVAASAGGAEAAGAISRMFFISDGAMAVLHDWVFATGFILCGLAAWTNSRQAGR